MTGLDDDQRSSPPVTPGPRSEAEQIIAEGRLDSFAATESGALLTVWGTCDFLQTTDCGNAWRLGTGSPAQATGTLGIGEAGGALASGDGFVLMPARDQDLGFRIAQEGTVSPLSFSRDCRDISWSTRTEPGRLVWTSGLNFVDTVTGTLCDTGDSVDAPSRKVPSPPTATLWALVDNEANPVTLSIGRYDGKQWRYRDLAASGSGAWTSLIAAAGSNVVVLLANPSPTRTRSA